MAKLSGGELINELPLKMLLPFTKATEGHRFDVAEPLAIYCQSPEDRGVRVTMDSEYPNGCELAEIPAVCILGVPTEQFINPYLDGSRRWILKVQNISIPFRREHGEACFEMPVGKQLIKHLNDERLAQFLPEQVRDASGLPDEANTGRFLDESFNANEITQPVAPKTSAGGHDHFIAPAIDQLIGGPNPSTLIDELEEVGCDRQREL